MRDDPGSRAKSLRRRRRISSMVAARSTISGPWSEAEIIALIRLREAGESNVNIALSLGRTYDSVSGKVRALVSEGRGGRVCHPRYSPEDDRALIEMYEAGETPSYIARILGRSPQAIRQRRFELGIPAIRKSSDEASWSAQDDDMLFRLYEANYPTTEIAVRLGRSRSAVKFRASELRRRGVQVPRLLGGMRHHVTP